MPLSWKNKEKDKKISCFSLCMLFFSLAFYLFFAFYDGAVICVDSPSYINMDFAREPFYPLFLAFFRLSGSEDYLFYAVVVQSILMAFAGWLLADYLRKRLSIHKIYSLCLYFLPIATSLLCRFAAKRASMYTNSIMTEGICISLYLLFIYCILNCLWERSRIHMLIAFGLSLIMISTRKQMLMVLPILFLAMVYMCYKDKNLKRAILIAGIGCILIFPAFRLFDSTYNYFLSGTFQGHSSDNRFVTTMVFYIAKESDAEYIQDEDVRQLFLDIYRVCDENGYLGLHAGEGWYQEVSHFGDHYDHIQIDTMWPMILQHARDTINAEYEYTDLEISQAEMQTYYDVETDRLNSVIITSVLPHQIPEFVKALLNNFLSGLVTTIAQCRPILIPYTVVMFLLYLALTFRLIRYYRLKTAVSAEENLLLRRSVIFSGIVLLGIFFNVSLVSAVIFCQTRYTIYNMPLFYMAGAVLLYRNMTIWKLIKNRKSGESISTADSLVHTKM